MENQIQVVLEKIIFTAWEMTGAENIQEALKLSGQKENVQEMLDILDLTLKDLEIETPAHCKELYESDDYSNSTSPTGEVD